MSRVYTGSAFRFRSARKFKKPNGSILWFRGECLPKSPSFYFGSVIFFVGVLLIAVGVSNAVAQGVSVLTFAELISGAVLILVGSRAIRRV